MKRSVSIRSRPRRTRATSARALSYRIRAGTPPRRAKAITWPSRNASWPSRAEGDVDRDARVGRGAARTPRPGCARRAMNTSDRPKSTWASSPGSWWATIATSTWSRCELAAARADVPADGRLGDVGALLVDEALPDPARRVALLARRRPGPRSASARIVAAWGPIAGWARDSTGLRGGGTADARAWRTARRCTLCRRASSRIDTPSSRCSRRIRSNCSTLDNSSDPRFGGLARPAERRERWGRGWGQF